MFILFPSLLLLLSLCEVNLAEVSQPIVIQTVSLGEAVTLTCYTMGKWPKRMWYKLNYQRRLQLVATVDLHTNQIVFADEFRYRRSVKLSWKDNHLTISTTSWEDAGRYFCGVLEGDSIQFGNGTFLMVKGAQLVSNTVVQHPESQSVETGQGVTLSCLVHAGQCEAKQINVKWVKVSNRSDTAGNYLTGNNTSAVCQWTKSKDITCIYTFNIQSFSSMDVGAYFCVVTLCGKTVFGNGSKLFLKDEADIPLTSTERPTLPLPILLSVFLPVCVCVILLGICLFADSCYNSCFTKEEDLKQLEQREATWSECVYLTVRKHS